MMSRQFFLSSPFALVAGQQGLAFFFRSVASHTAASIHPRVLIAVFLLIIREKEGKRFWHCFLSRGGGEGRRGEGQIGVFFKKKQKAKRWSDHETVSLTTVAAGSSAAEVASLGAARMGTSSERTWSQMSMPRLKKLSYTRS